jgi:predicted RNase H-like nuclease (RuvC/YqgF family)
LKLSKTPFFIPANDVKAEVIMREKSISKAISDLSPKIESEQVSVEKPELPKPVATDDSIIRELRRKISNLTLFNEQLKEENNKLKSKIKELEARFKIVLDEEAVKLRRERAYRIKEEEIINLREQVNQLKNTISKLQNEIHNLKSIKTLEAQGKIKPIKIARNFSKESLTELDQQYGILKNDIIFLEDATGGGSGTAEILIERGVKAVITRNDMSHLALEKLISAEIPVIPVEAVDLSKYSDFYAVDAEKFSKVYNKFLEDIRRRKTGLTVDKLIEIINEYRSSRISYSNSQT